MGTNIVLMHKNISVAEYEIDADTGRIMSSIKVLEKEHLPLPVQFNLKNDFTAVDALQNWIACRSIPQSRCAFTEFLEKFKVSTPSAAAYKSLASSVTLSFFRAILVGKTPSCKPVRKTVSNSAPLA